MLVQMVTIPASKEKVLFLCYKTTCQMKNFLVRFLLTEYVVNGIG
jgi:hypothetical protein